MDRSYLSRLTTANSERVLLALTHQQHLHPARTIDDVARSVCQDQGFPAFIGQRAARELAMQGPMRIGRLSRQQIRDLAERMEAAWQAELADRIRTLEPQGI